MIRFFESFGDFEGCRGQSALLYYVRYSDDFVLLHEDQARLLRWREAIRAFLCERLQLADRARPAPL